MLRGEIPPATDNDKPGSTASLGAEANSNLYKPPATLISSLLRPIFQQRNHPEGALTPIGFFEGPVNP